jgi:hypothetical protein
MEFNETNVSFSDRLCKVKEGGKKKIDALIIKTGDKFHKCGIV